MRVHPTFRFKTRQLQICQTQQGFTYFALLIVLAVFALASSQVVQLGAAAQRRFLEQELLWVGTQYARAIQSYVEANPNSAPGRPPQYPQKLEDLLQDSRFPNVRRHLRKLYPDPLTGQAWGLSAAPQSGILGVYSVAAGAPIKQTGFADAAIATSSLPNPGVFENRNSYKDWLFGYAPTAPAAGGAAVSPSPNLNPNPNLGANSNPSTNLNAAPALNR